jgi:hypothetical protein
MKHLAQLAPDLISIPAISAEVDRVFSQAKRLITTDRKGLADGKSELFRLLENWRNNELIGRTMKDLRPNGFTK